MHDLMMLGPEGSPGRFLGIGAEVPVEIIAADGGEKDESHQPARRIDAGQEPAGLPDHQDSA